MTEATGTALAKKPPTELEEAQGAIQLLLALEKEGKADEVSLQLTDPDMPVEQWVALGRLLGSIDRRSRWYIGDWINFGSDIYGDDGATQHGVESTQRERYDEAERITGLDHATLLNVSSICRRVARSRRRKELGFWVHAEVAALEPTEQKKWLGKAVKEGLSRSSLRDAIRLEKDPPADDDDGGFGDGPLEGGGLSIGERIEAAARNILASAQATPRHTYEVPAEQIAQLREALGEEH